MPAVELIQAPPEAKPAFANMFQLYVHDFSEQWWDQERGELEDNGLFGEGPPMDQYWTEPDHVPFLIRVGGRLAGFVLLDTHSYSGQPLDRNVAEFFVARKHRRGGVGTTAVHAVFDRYPGRWEAAVTRRNTGALPFWRKVVATHPRVRDVEEIDSQNDAWNGAILRFVIDAAAT